MSYERKHMRAIASANYTETIAWDDLRAPVNGTLIWGFGTDPAIDADLGGLLFDAATIEGPIYQTYQIPHGYKEGTDLKLHFHWEKAGNGSGSVLWEGAYTVAKYGEVRSAQTVVTASTPVVDSDVADTHMITPIATIDGTGLQISDIIEVQIRRVANDAADDYTDDARLLSVDIHYQIDGRGSYQEFIK